MTTLAAQRPALPAWAYDLLQPRNLVAGMITATLALAEWQFHVIDGPVKMIAALGSCLAVEAALGWLLLGRRVPLQSAWVSATSLTVLLRPHGDAVWPYVVGAILAIGSKYVIRYRDRHLWNPTNLAVCALLLLAGPSVGVLGDQWGNTVVVNSLVWLFGLLVSSRARMLHVTLTYVGGFITFACLRAAALDQPLWGELAPLTGPMYQLMSFFMMTDPRTVVSSRRGQIAVAATITAVEALLRTGLSLGWSWCAPFAAAPAMFSLFLVGPLALMIDLSRRPAAP
jgi:Na+-transporting NADH:ubiquinone oxidoreductase subunit NqrB